MGLRRAVKFPKSLFFFFSERRAAAFRKQGLAFGPTLICGERAKGAEKLLGGIFEDPQVRAARTVFEFEDPEAGRMRLLRNPARFSATPTDLRHAPPRLGEHTDAILAEAG